MWQANECEPVPGISMGFMQSKRRKGKLSIQCVSGAEVGESNQQEFKAAVKTSDWVKGGFETGLSQWD